METVTLLRSADEGHVVVDDQQSVLAGHAIRRLPVRSDSRGSCRPRLIDEQQLGVLAISIPSSSHCFSPWPGCRPARWPCRQADGFQDLLDVGAAVLENGAIKVAPAAPAFDGQLQVLQTVKL